MKMEPLWKSHNPTLSFLHPLSLSPSCCFHHAAPLSRPAPAPPPPASTPPPLCAWPGCLSVIQCVSLWPCSMWLSCTLAPNGPSQWGELPPCCLYQGQVCAYEHASCCVCLVGGWAALWIVCVLCLRTCSLAESRVCGQISIHVRVQLILVVFNRQLWFNCACICSTITGAWLCLCGRLLQYIELYLFEKWRLRSKCICYVYYVTNPYKINVYIQYQLSTNWAAPAYTQDACVCVCF